MRDRWRRTPLISRIVAPERSRSRVMACLSASASPTAGNGISAEPPPEIRQITRSSGPSPATRCNISSAARWPASIGRGWAASSTRMRGQSTPWRYAVTTVPTSSPSQCRSRASAMAAAALPAPTATVRPWGRAGRNRGTQTSGLAASMAAAKAARRRKSGFTVRSPLDLLRTPAARALSASSTPHSLRVQRILHSSAAGPGTYY